MAVLGFLTLVPPAVCAEDPPVLREVEVRGASAFDHDKALQIVKVRPGERLFRDAQVLASTLQNRYRTSGYLAARVDGAFDAATGKLVLTVDEGRIAEVVLAGVEGPAEARARRELRLETGAVLKENDIWDALRRVETKSRGSVIARPEEPFVVTSGPEGARLEVKLQTIRTQWSLGPFGPRTAGLYNRVDGLNPGVRARFTLTDPGSYDDLDLYGRVSYGLESHEPRYVAGARRSFGSGRFTLGYELHDLTDTDDGFRGSLVRGGEGAAIHFGSFHDYYQRRGHEAYAFTRISPAALLGLTWRSDTYGNLPVETDGSLLFSRIPRPNPEVDEGVMRSVIATFRWTSGGELFGTLARERESYLTRSLYGTPFPGTQALRAEATYEVASADGLGGAFTFSRFIAHVRGQRPLPHGAVAVRVLVGLTGGEPPLQKRLAIGGRGTLRGYEVKEFPGENMAVASVEWEALAPRFPVPGVVAFYDGGLTWGGPVTSDGWRSATGVGFEWARSGTSLLRVDVGVRLGPADGRKRVHVLLRLRVPL